MATKTIDKTPLSIEQLRAKLTEHLTGTPYEVPNWGTVEVVMLKNIEIEQLTEKTRREDGTTDPSLWNRMTAAFGLVQPSVTVDELTQYPQSFIVPVANKIWELTNAYGEQTAKAADEPVNFPKRSASSTGSPTDTTASPAK